MSETTTTGPAIRKVDGRLVPAAGTWEIDPSHSSFEFVARHLMAKVRGRFTSFGGEVRIAEVPEESSVTVTLETASVDTREPRRDGHLRSADFFDAERYPTITFRSTRLRPADGDFWELDGELTVRDVTRPITFQLEFLGAATDPFGNQKVGFSAVAADVDREAWGLTWNAALETGGFLVGRTVRLEIEVELVRK
jgi:polyisoprenoid-binding protein YceI